MNIKYGWAETATSAISYSSWQTIQAGNYSLAIMYNGTNHARGRVLYVYYNLTINLTITEEALIGPILHSFTLNATRRVFATTEDLQYYGDDLEAQFAVQKANTYEFFANVTLDSTRTTEPVLFMVADYFDFPALGAQATLYLDNYTISLWNGKARDWIDLCLEKRIENTIDAKIIDNVSDYTNANGEVQIKFWYKANHFVNVHIDYVGIAYYSDIQNLLNITYYHHLDLARASQIYDVYPTAVNPTQIHLGTNISSGLYTSQTPILDPSSEDLRGITLTRTLNEFASGNVTNNEAISRSNSSYLSVISARRGYGSGSFDSSKTSSSDERIWGERVWEIPVPGIDSIGSYCIEISVQVSMRRYIEYEFAWRTRDYSTTRDCSSFASLSSSPDPKASSDGWSSSGSHSLKGTYNLSPGGTVPVYIWGKYSIQWYEHLLYHRKTQMHIWPGSYSIKVVKNLPSFDVQSNLTVDIPIEMLDELKSKESLRGVLLMGTIGWNAYDANSYFYNTPSSSENVAEQSYKILIAENDTWGLDPFYDNWATIPFAGEKAPSITDAAISNHIGSHPDEYVIPYDGSTGSFLDPSFIIDDDGLKIRLYIEVNYSRTFFNAAKFNVPWWWWWFYSTAQYGMGVQITASNLRAIPLLADGAFVDWGQMNYVDFGAEFEFDTKTLQTAEYNITADNAWYFATHLKYSIHSCWTDDLATFTTFRPGATLSYKVGISIVRLESSSQPFGAYEWIVANPDKFNVYQPLTAATASQDYEVVLVESEDRASIYDPNALRLGSTDVKRYFINGTKILFRVNITIRIDCVETVDYQKSAAWGPDAPHKQFKVTFESYTTIDVLKFAEKKNNLHTLQGAITLPIPTNPELAGKMVYAKLSIGGQIELISAELYHFEVDGMGLRIGTITNEGGYEILTEYSLHKEPHSSFADVLFIPYSKLQGMTELQLFVEIGYWNGRFVGLYDDAGVLAVKLDYLKLDYLFSTGFFDKDAGRAYVDQCIDINLGYSLSDNITSIIVTGEIDAVIQGLEVREDEVVKLVSFVQPYMKIYNWETQRYDVMAVFALGGSSFQYVVDAAIVNPLDYINEGKIRLLAVLDGRMQIDESSFADFKYYAQMTIKSLECELAEFNVYPTQGSNQNFKPAADQIQTDSWPACITDLNYRKDLILDNTPDQYPVVIEVVADFVGGLSEGLFPYAYAIIGNAEPLPTSIECLSVGQQGLIATARIRVLISNESNLIVLSGGNKGIRLYWATTNVGYSFTNNTITGQLFDGSISQGVICSKSGCMPFIGLPSEDLPSIYNLDFTSYQFISSGSTRAQDFLFILGENMYYPSANVTGFEIHIVLTSAQELVGQVGFWDIASENFMYYSLPDFSAQQIYFSTPYTRYYIFPFQASDFAKFYSDDGAILLKFCIQANSNGSLNSSLNLLELELKYNEKPEALEGQTYLKYIADDEFISSIAFFDNFDDTSLGTRYLGNVQDFSVEESHLTKIPRTKYSSFHHPAFWWIPRFSPSYLLVNKSNDLEDYYARFNFNIQDTWGTYETVSWMVRANMQLYPWFGPQITGILFRLHAYESRSHHNNELEIWERSNNYGVWRLADLVTLPFLVHVNTWYDITTFVNGSLVELWLNGTKFYSKTHTRAPASGYFGFYSFYPREYFVDNVILSKKYISGESWGDYFAQINIQMPSNNELHYGDAINVSITPIPAYEGTLADQKLNLMVNSSDGWLFLDEQLTDSTGQGTFAIDTVDLYTKNLLGNAYERQEFYELIANTTVEYAHDGFEGSFEETWVSDYIDDFSTENGYLEKSGYFFGDYILTAPAGLPTNYTFEFQAQLNEYNQDEQLDWVVDSDQDLSNAWGYTLYSAVNDWYPNTLQVYKIMNNRKTIVDEVILSPEIYINQWHFVQFFVSESDNNITHTLYLNNELVYQRNFTLEEYGARRSYLGFIMEDRGISQIDNMSVYTGSAQWRQITYDPFIEGVNATTSAYEDVLYTVDGVTRLEDLKIATSPYSLSGNNTISMQLNMSFPDILNQYGEKFHLADYYGVRVGVLIPYDETVQQVIVYILDSQGNRHDGVLEGLALQALYENPNSRALFINGTRMIHTFIDVGLKNTWSANLDSMKILGVECLRKSYMQGKYEGVHVPNQIGVASLHLVRQLNNFSYNNYGFSSEPETEIAIWYQGEGVFYSSMKVIPQVYFRRLVTTLSLENSSCLFSTNFGGEIKVATSLSYGSSWLVPLLSLIIPAAFVLLVQQKGRKVIGGYEVVNGELYDLKEYDNYTFNIRTFIDAGLYYGAEIMWFGNGLFTNASCILPTTLEIFPAPTSIELITDNYGFDYGYPVSFEGTIYDNNHEMLKDQTGLTYLEDFEGITRSSIDNNTNINPIIGPNCTFAGKFKTGDYFTVITNNLANLNMEVPFINLFKFQYWTNSSDFTFKVTLAYQFPDLSTTTRSREFQPSATNSWIDVIMNTEFDESEWRSSYIGQPILIDARVQVKSPTSQNAMVMLDELEFAHDPLVYLQVRTADTSDWTNLTASPFEMDQTSGNSFKLPLFTKGKQFLLNNLHELEENTPTLNGYLIAGDYQIRIWYPGCSKYYQPTSALSFIRVNPIETAIFYVPDLFEGPSRDGFYDNRTYNSTSVFAREAGKPFTLLDIGYTWGDTKNLTFLLSEKEGGFNGIPNKPVWFQVGIVPTTQHGLKDRDYFADYYPLVRNIQTGMLVEQPFMIQDKYGRPIVYDYYDYDNKSIKFYGPYLWMVGFTDENGYVTFPLDFAPNLMQDLYKLFPGVPLNNIDKDLYIRVFYDNSFNWIEKVMPIQDTETEMFFECTAAENTRNPEHIFDRNDLFAWETQYGSHYFDGIYASSYAEGVLDCRQEDLKVTGENFEVTNNGDANDIIPMLAYVSEFSTYKNGTVVTETLVLDEFNHLDQITVHFFIVDPITNVIMLGDEKSAFVYDNPDKESGRVYIELNASKIVSLVPGYYDIYVYTPESEYYQTATTTFRMLLKSQYTYEFGSPTTLVDFNYEMDNKASPFYVNASTNAIESNFEQDFMYPKLMGCVWLAADPDPTITSDGVGVTISLNNYPIFDQVIFPVDGAVPFEMSLEYFVGETITLNFSTWTDEELIGRDVEFPYSGTNQADWVHFNATIFAPTFTDPVQGEPIYDIIADFNTLIQEEKVNYANIVIGGVKVENSAPIGQSNLVPSLLVFPAGINPIPSSVALELDYIAVVSPLTTLNTNADPSDGEEYLDGFVVSGSSFDTGIRHAYIAHPFDQSSNNIVGAITMNATSEWVGLNYFDVYCPFEGYFESILYAPFIQSGEAVIFEAILNAGMEDQTSLASATISGSGPQVLWINGTIDEEYYSTTNNITLRVKQVAGSNRITVFWISANLTGYEDLLYVSNRLPHGRAALFSSNFLYYYVQSAADIGYDPECNPNTVWLQVENSPGNNGPTLPHYDLASNILKIYELAGPSQMGTKAGRDALNKSTLMNYTFVEDRGIFIRNQFFNLGNISTPEVHAAYYSMYAHDDANNPDFTKLLGRRKITIVANPYSWTTNPATTSLHWNTAKAHYSTSLSQTQFDTKAQKTIARLYYTQEPYAEDKVFDDWDYYHFQDHWNRSGALGIGFDYWYNKMVYTGALFQQGAIPQNNLLDFYPAPVNSYDNWADYNEVIINLGTNNSYLVENFQINAYSSAGTLLTTQEFSVTTNESKNYYLDLNGINFANIAKLELWCLPNVSRPLANTQEVFFSSEGIALSHKSRGVSFNITYQDGSSTSTRVPRSYFADYAPFEVDLQPSGAFKPIQNVSLVGLVGSQIDLSQVSVFQNAEDPAVNPYTQTALISDFNFDSNTQQMENIQRFLNNEPLQEGQWHVVGGAVGTDLAVNNIFNPYVKLHYWDYNFDGIYDMVERYEDHDKRGFYNGIGDFYALDAQNDGVFEKAIYRNVIVQTQPVGDDPANVITQYKKTEQVTDVITNSMGTFTVVTEDSTFQAKQAGQWLPEVRTHSQSLSLEQNPRPIYIFEDIDEWRSGSGTEDYEIHRISTWNETLGTYEIEEWHDWAVTLRVRFLAEEEEEQVITGILDKGVTRVKMDPAAPISNQEVKGTILWFNSYLPGVALAPFYDTGLVILQEAWSYSYEFNAGTHTSTLSPNDEAVLCIGIIMDLNRDHIWQQERPGSGSGEADSYQADVYAPIWELNSLGRYIIRQMAHDEAWRNWQETNSKAETIVNMIVSIVVSVAITMLVTAALAPLLGPLAPIVGGFLGSLISSLVMQYLISPFLSWVFDPEGYEKNERIKNNQELLLKTRVPAPPMYSFTVRSGRVTPDSVYKHYEALFNGYQVAVQGVFSEIPSGKGLQSESDPPLTIINSKVWVFDQEAPEFLDGGDIFSIVWGFVQNPFGLIKAGSNALDAAMCPEEYRAARYLVYQDQRAALINAYENLLEYPDGVHVVIYPSRREGSPMFLAVKDDTRSSGISNFWNFSDPVIELADRSMVVYAAKYQNFMSTDWRSTLASIAVMVIQMIAQMGLTKLGTKFVSSHSKYISGKKPCLYKGSAAKAAKLQNGVWGRLGNDGFLKELAEEIFVEEFLIHSLGGFIEDKLQLSFEAFGWENPDDWLLPGWDLGDWIEWGLAALSSSKSFTEQSMRMAVSNEVKTKPGCTQDAKTATEAESKAPSQVDQDTKLPEVTKKISQKIQKSKLSADVQTRIQNKAQQKYQAELKQQLKKVVYTEFVKLNEGTSNRLIRSECKKIVQKLMAEPNLTPRKIMNELATRLTTEHEGRPPLLQSDIFFDMEITFSDGTSIRFSEGVVESDVKNSISLDTPFSELLLRADIKKVNFIDPKKKGIAKSEDSFPKTVTKPATDTSSVQEGNLGDTTKISDNNLETYMKKVLKINIEEDGKLGINARKKLWQMGIQTVEELKFAEIHKLPPKSLLKYGYNRRVNSLIKIDKILSSTATFDDFKNTLSTLKSQLVGKRGPLQVMAETLCEFKGAEKMLAEFKKDLANVVGHLKVEGSNKNPDIIGLLASGDKILGDGKFYARTDFLSGCLMSQNTGTEYKAYNSIKGAGNEFTIYTIQENIQNQLKEGLVTDLNDAKKFDKLKTAMKEKYGILNAELDPSLTKIDEERGIVSQMGIKGTVDGKERIIRIQSIGTIADITSELVDAIKLIKYPNADVTNQDISSFIETFWAFKKGVYFEPDVED